MRGHKYSRGSCRKTLSAFVAQALLCAILTWGRWGISVTWMLNLLMAQEHWDAKVLNGTDLVEFDDSSLHELLKPVTDLLSIDVGIARKDFVFELLGGIAPATHVIDKGKQADKQEASLATTLGQSAVREEIGLDSSIAWHEKHLWARDTRVGKTCH